MIEYLNVAPDYGVEKIVPPAKFLGRTLGELDLHRRLGLSAVAIRRGDRVTVNPAASERVGEGDELVLIGPDDRLERLREYPAATAPPKASRERLRRERGEASRVEVPVECERLGDRLAPHERKARLVHHRPGSARRAKAVNGLLME